MSYSERNAPRHEPAGAGIPSGVRLALLSWIEDLDVADPPTPKEIWRRLMQRIGYGDVLDVLDDVETRFGSDAGEPVLAAFQAERARRRSVPQSDPSRYAVPALSTIPAPLFLDALEIAVELLGGRPRVYEDIIEYDDGRAVEEINRLFTVRGINYRFREDGKAEWHGDEGTYAQVVAPALIALADPLLLSAAKEFGDALNGLRNGTRVGHKNAIRDASNAVETTMKTLLDEHGIERQGNETADPLWELLHRGGVVAAKTKDPITASPRLRNAYGGHGPNPDGEPVPAGIPELAVHSASTAITYLAALLPGA
jgi:hypothetical protein